MRARLVNESKGNLDHIYQSMENVISNRRWDDIVLMPIDLIWDHKEFDREKNPLRKPEYLDSLEKDIIEKGFTEPLHMTIDGVYALLTEGNHRLAVGKRLGLEYLPVAIHKKELYGIAKSHAKIASDELDEFLYEEKIKKELGKEKYERSKELLNNFRR